MSEPFFQRPILNSPYEYPSRHWKLDDRGLPTSEIVKTRRTAKFISPVPAPKALAGKPTQPRLPLGEKELSSSGAAVQPVPRHQQDPGGGGPLEGAAGGEVGGDTGNGASPPALARTTSFQDLRPFFCQIEAAETAIWLVEVARALRDSGTNLAAPLARHLEPPSQRKREREPRTPPHRPEDGDRRGQDNGDGDADRVADGERDPAARQ